MRAPLSKLVPAAADEAPATAAMRVACWCASGDSVDVVAYGTARDVAAVRVADTARAACNDAAGRDDVCGRRGV